MNQQDLFAVIYFSLCVALAVIFLKRTATRTDWGVATAIACLFLLHMPFLWLLWGFVWMLEKFLPIDPREAEATDRFIAEWYYAGCPRDPAKIIEITKRT